MMPFKMLTPQRYILEKQFRHLIKGKELKKNLGTNEEKYAKKN
jgi:hypothetical protein